MIDYKKELAERRPELLEATRQCVAGNGNYKDELQEMRKQVGDLVYFEFLSELSLVCLADARAQVQNMIRATKAAGVNVLDDGSAFMTGSFPLPRDHWLYLPRPDTKPTPPYAHIHGFPRDVLIRNVVAATKLALKQATDDGKAKDFDPDSVLQNLVLNLIGDNEFPVQIVACPDIPDNVVIGVVDGSEPVMITGFGSGEVKCSNLKQINPAEPA